MHNEEVPRFLKKLKVIITFGLGRFISSKEIFPCSRVVDDIRSTASRKMSLPFRIQDVRLGGNVDIKITRTYRFNEKPVCELSNALSVVL